MIALRVLHILDHSTSIDAAEALALLAAADRNDPSIVHHFAILGHRSTGSLLVPAEAPPAPPRWFASDPPASPPKSDIHMLPSMGWADPAGWRALRRLAGQLAPTHLHAWGISGAVAAALAGSSAARIVTLADIPSSAGRGVLRFINRPRSSPISWVGMSQWVNRGLIQLGLAPEKLSYVPPGIPVPLAPLQADPALRADLGLTSEDFPVLLLGGDGSTSASRHDYGLWVGAILQQIFPRVRVIVREDPRGRQNHGLERLFNDLPDGEVPILAPADYSLDQLLPLADYLLVSAQANITSGSILHAMAAGVPVVGTAIESVREIIDDRRNGLLAGEIKPRALTACIEELINDQTLKNRLTHAARADVSSRFRPAALVDAYHQIYKMENAPAPSLR